MTDEETPGEWTVEEALRANNASHAKSLRESFRNDPPSADEVFGRVSAELWPDYVIVRMNATHDPDGDRLQQVVLHIEPGRGKDGLTGPRF